LPTRGTIETPSQKLYFPRADFERNECYATPGPWCCAECCENLKIEILCRFRRVQNLVKLSYRLMKQSVKSCEKNAAVVVKHVPLFRKHLGGNLACAATIRELYEGKRVMLNKITEEQVGSLPICRWRHPYCIFLSFFLQCLSVIFWRCEMANLGWVMF
jgi:hypothetical protein